MNLLDTQITVNLVYSILLICIGTGSLFAFRYARRGGIVTIQSAAIAALEARISAIQADLNDLRDENGRLKQQLETIQAALAKRGIHITMDGESITISEKNSRDTITPVTAKQPRLKLVPKPASQENKDNA